MDYIQYICTGHIFFPLWIKILFSSVFKRTYTVYQSYTIQQEIIIIIKWYYTALPKSIIHCISVIQLVGCCGCTHGLCGVSSVSAKRTVEHCQRGQRGFTVARAEGDRAGLGSAAYESLLWTTHWLGTLILRQLVVVWPFFKPFLLAISWHLNNSIHTVNSTQVSPFQTLYNVTGMEKNMFIEMVLAMRRTL